MLRLVVCKIIFFKYKVYFMYLKWHMMLTEVRWCQTLKFNISLRVADIACMQSRKGVPKAISIQLNFDQEIFPPCTDTIETNF